MKKELDSIPVPLNRVVCIVCRKPFKRDELNVCTSAGVIILACHDHATIGDRVVRVAQVVAMEMAQ